MTTTTTIWRATVLTLFPEMFPGPLGVSLAGRALASGLWALEPRDIRDSATDRHPSAGPVRRATEAFDEPAGSAIDPVADCGTRRGARPLDRLRPVRGGRSKGDRGAEPRGGLDRRLCALGRRDRRHRADRRLRPLAARSDGKGRIRRGRELFGGIIGISAIYPSADLRGDADPGHPVVGGPCQGRGLAESRGRGPDKGAAAGFVGGEAGPKPDKK